MSSFQVLLPGGRSAGPAGKDDAKCRHFRSYCLVAGLLGLLVKIDATCRHLSSGPTARWPPGPAGKEDNKCRCFSSGPTAW